MFTNQKRFARQIQTLLLAAAFVWICGCTPAGPRALLRGKRLLDEGKFVAAVDELKVATSILTTNAQAWNYLGLAYHHAGQPAEAVEAYQRALKLDHDLIAVHYNLGCLLLEQNRPDTLEGARNEFTAFTLHQGKNLDGWLKLGTTQLRLNELPAADASFRQALQLSPQNAEAFNDLGLIQLQRRHWRDAATYFNSALRLQPKYGPALLNLATTEVYLNRRQDALQHYREYLALSPHQPNWESAYNTAQQLDEELNPTPHPVALAPTNTATAPPSNNTVRAPIITNNPRPEPPSNTARIVTAPPQTRPEPVRVTEPAPSIQVAENTPPPANHPAPAPKSAVDDGSVPPPDAVDTQPKPAKRGFFGRLNPMQLFRHQSKPAVTNFAEPNALPPAVPLTPEAAPAASNTPAEVVAKPVPPRVITIPRYPYLRSGIPGGGNRSDAEIWMAKGVEAQRAQRWHDAETNYINATAADPSYFDAQMNLGALTFAQHDLPQTLRAYEMALVLKPDSFEARYHFGVALKQANYIQDASEEFERLLAASPSESPARLAAVHLELGNLYAEQFRRPSMARPHYLKVLDLDPRNSQATAIRYWLVNNPNP